MKTIFCIMLAMSAMAGDQSDIERQQRKNEDGEYELYEPQDEGDDDA